MANSKNSKFPAPIRTLPNEGFGGEDGNPTFRRGEFKRIGIAAALNDTPYSPNRKAEGNSPTGDRMHQ